METGNLFNEFYYKHNCGMPYERNEGWLAAFDLVAERIVSDINPKTVLDAGCAMGFLVERLRTRGVEAWGIDISEYAISRVDSGIKDFCWVGSITDELPQNYDLIVSIEVLEHMPVHSSVQAVERLCKHTDDVLISVSHGDFKESTHLNVQPPEYWARNFCRENFYHDVDFDASFITPWAARYRRQKVVLPVIAAYERKTNLLTIENKELRQALIDLHSQLDGMSQKIMGLENGDEINKLQDQVREWELRWNDLESGVTWKLLKKVQDLRVGLIPPGSSRERLLQGIKGKRGRWKTEN